MEDIKLKFNKEDRAQIMPIGDIQLGSPTCDEELLKEKIQQCLQKKIYVIGMGDWAESGTRSSVGAAVYEQILNPQAQIDKLVKLFTPLAEAGLLLYILAGNHEQRISDSMGIDTAQLIAKLLSVPYLGYCAFVNLIVGKEKYSVYSTHGTSNAAQVYGKIKAATDIAKIQDAEITLYAHTHGLFDYSELKYISDDETIDRHIILTGSFLKYKGSYAEKKGLPPARLGTALINLYGKKHQIFVSL